MTTGVYFLQEEIRALFREMIERGMISRGEVDRILSPVASLEDPVPIELGSAGCERYEGVSGREDSKT